MSQQAPNPAPDDASLHRELETLQQGFHDAQCDCNPCNCPTANHPCNQASAPPPPEDFSNAGLRRMLEQLTREVNDFVTEQNTAPCVCAARAGAGQGEGEGANPA